MAKLWAASAENSDEKVEQLVDRYTAADDALLDNRLVEMDLYTNAAHVRMLAKQGYMNRQELDEILQSLRGILDDYRKGDFVVRAEDEDVHTCIENRVTAEIGEAGGRIHTGRSRNDQVLTDLRLFIQLKLLKVIRAVAELGYTFTGFGLRHAEVPMPGYTHMQRAMPSSVALWAGAFAEACKDDGFHLFRLLEYSNISPLGSGAGYGITLDIDRDETARLLGFARVQLNSIYCQNSRGKIESAVMSGLSNVMLTLGRLSSDLLLFTTSEYRFFKVPDSFTTGSSIMPQKKNLDVMELLRARVRSVLAQESLVKQVAATLPSGYSRDLQETKRPLLDSFDTVLDSLEVVKQLVEGLEPDSDRLRGALSPDVYAADAAFELVKGGMPFRDAYRKIKDELESLPEVPAQVNLDKGVTPGTPANPGLEELQGTLREFSEKILHCQSLRSGGLEQLLAGGD